MKKWFIMGLLMPISFGLMAQVGDKKTYIQFKVGQSRLADSHHIRAAEEAEKPELDVVTARDGDSSIYYLSVGRYYHDNIGISVDFLKSTYQLENQLQVIKGGILPTLASPKLPLGSLDGVDIPISDAKFDINAGLIFVDYRFDKHPFTNWSSYIGAGVGYAKLGLFTNDGAGNLLVDDTDNVAIYALRAGLEHPITADKIFSLEYSYLSSEKTNYTGASSGLIFHSKFEARSINMGIKFLF